MKVLTYIRKCNKEQLAQLLPSYWWSERTFDIVFEKLEIENQAILMQDKLFRMELPERIRFGLNTWINTKTRKVEQ